MKVTTTVRETTNYNLHDLFNITVREINDRIIRIEMPSKLPASLIPRAIAALNDILDKYPDVVLEEESKLKAVEAHEAEKVRNARQDTREDNRHNRYAYSE
jgi:hypothetical protein